MPSHRIQKWDRSIWWWWCVADGANGVHCTVALHLLKIPGAGAAGASSILASPVAMFQSFSRCFHFSLVSYTKRRWQRCPWIIQALLCECECDWCMKRQHQKNKPRTKTEKKKETNTNNHRENREMYNEASEFDDIENKSAQHAHTTNGIECLRISVADQAEAAQPRTKDGSVCLSFPNRFNITIFLLFYLCTPLLPIFERGWANPSRTTVWHGKKLYIRIITMCTKCMFREHNLLANGEETKRQEANAENNNKKSIEF